MSALGGFEVRSRFAGYHYFHFVSFQPSGLLSIRNYSELLTTLYSSPSSPSSSPTMELADERVRLISEVEQRW